MPVDKEKRGESRVAATETGGRAPSSRFGDEEITRILRTAVELRERSTRRGATVLGA